MSAVLSTKKENKENQFLYTVDVIQLQAFQVPYGMHQVVGFLVVNPDGAQIDLSGVAALAKCPVYE